MEAVAANAGCREMAGQGECLCHRRLCPVTRGVEASDLGHVRPTSADEADGFQVVGLVQRGQWDQGIQVLQAGRAFTARIIACSRDDWVTMIALASAARRRSRRDDDRRRR